MPISVKISLRKLQKPTRKIILKNQAKKLSVPIHLSLALFFVFISHFILYFEFILDPELTSFDINFKAMKSVCMKFAWEAEKSMKTNAFRTCDCHCGLNIQIRMWIGEKLTPEISGEKVKNSRSCHVPGSRLSNDRKYFFLRSEWTWEKIKFGNPKGDRTT